LSKALRLRPGDSFTASDARGRWCDCVFGDSAAAAKAGEVRHVVETGHQLTVGFALVKGSKPELVVQKLTELGIDNIVLLSAEHSVVSWDSDRSARNLVRLRRVAREAAMQSRRVRLPDVSGVLSPSAILDQASSNSSPVGFAEPGGRPARLDDQVILIGPEGGWSSAELGSGHDLISLSPQILRAETAAIVAGSLLAQLRSNLVAQAAPLATTLRVNEQ
ncbi:MAG: RsmE family RNA methyltransferase, partial [Acidimicrobiales bacterium]